MKDIVSINPATDEELARFAQHTPAQIEAMLARAAAAQAAWARTPLAERLQVLRQVAQALRSRKQALGLTITLEMGKPLAEAVGEVEKCAWNFDHYAEAAPGYLQDQVIASNATDSRVVYDPVGVVLAVMPWNYPLWQVMRAAAPVLAGGNALVLKHASNVPQCALAMQQVMQDAGVPEGLFTTVLVDAAGVPALIADPRVAAVTFTGSTPAGRQIAGLAAQALKKQVLELGGSDPFVVLADADVPAAAAVAVKARFQNTGQSCIAAKRFIVHEAVADVFVQHFCEGVRALVVGDPQAASSTQGSMAKRHLREELHQQVLASVREGAQLLMGGQPIDGPGAFYAPAVLDHVQPHMTVAREETFGPAAAILRVPDVATAIRVANDTPFGLGAALWSQDLEQAQTLVHQLQAGAVFINGMVASDPRLPFGGSKASGYGRELGALGLHEFMQIKTVWRGPARV